MAEHTATAATATLAQRANTMPGTIKRTILRRLWAGAQAHISTAPDTGTGLSVEIHEHAVPASAVAALEKLHGSLYASLRYLQLSEPDQPAPHCWVCHQQGAIVGVLLFRLQRHCARVLTEVVTLERWQIDAFARSVFARYPQVHHLAFNAVVLHHADFSFPVQRYTFSENYVLSLPASEAAYFEALGKSTRKTIRGYGNRLQRDVPGLVWRAQEARTLTPAARRLLVSRLQAFKRASMDERGKKADIDPAETRRLLTLATECGLFGVATVAGRICAGSLACRVGDHYVMLLSAADPAYAQYRLGLLTCLWSIRDCLLRGARECHLLWGRYPYKAQLLAVPRPLQRLTVYRSRAAQLAHPSTVVAMAGRAAFYAVREFLRYRVQERSDPLSRLCASALRQARQLRTALRRRTAQLRQWRVQAGRVKVPLPGEPC